MSQPQSEALPTLRISVLRWQGVPLPSEPPAPFFEFDPRGGCLGRDESCELHLPDPQRHVSRLQARIEFDGQGFWLVDLGSNPTRVDGQPLGRGRRLPLAGGEQLAIGDYELEVVALTRGTHSAQPLPSQRLSQSGQSRHEFATSVPIDDPFAVFAPAAAAAQLAPVPLTHPFAAPSSRLAGSASVLPIEESQELRAAVTRDMASGTYSFGGLACLRALIRSGMDSSPSGSQIISSTTAVPKTNRYQPCAKRSHSGSSTPTAEPSTPPVTAHEMRVGRVSRSLAISAVASAMIVRLAPLASTWTASVVPNGTRIGLTCAHRPVAVGARGDLVWTVSPVFEITPGAKALVIDKTGFSLASTGLDLIPDGALNGLGWLGWMDALDGRGGLFG
mgnify:CR=1 FL=1